MGKKDLQKEILEQKGLTFSAGTHSLIYLLAQAYDLMVEYNLRTPLKKEILEAFDYQDEKPINNSMVDAIFYGRELVDECKADSLWMRVSEYFQALSPCGYAFVFEGDGSMLGWYVH